VNLSLGFQMGGDWELQRMDLAELSLGTYTADSLAQCGKHERYIEFLYNMYA
jgi:hypothetical protein